MKDEKVIRLEIQKGIKAKQLLNEPLIKEFFSNYRGNIIDKLSESHIDAETEKEYVRMLKVSTQFKKSFEDHVNQGKKSESALERLLNNLKGGVA